MAQQQFPSLADSDWHPTRNALHVYSQVAGKIRRALAPPRKHWWHVSLRAAAAGLTTTPVPAGAFMFELLLDFTQHRLSITTSRGEEVALPLPGQSAAAFRDGTLEALARFGIDLEIDRSPFDDPSPLAYDPEAASRLWQTISQVDMVLKRFQGHLREETSPVQLWPHHFDLAMLWLSGRLVPDQDPEDEEWADEQMNFGFSTGGDSISEEPYFYITAYPFPDGLLNARLPSPAGWRSDGWQGAILPYAAVAEAFGSGENLLLSFLRSAQRAGAALMKSS